MVHSLSTRLTSDNSLFTKMNDIRGLKKNLTLDLHKDTSRSKKTKYETPLLSTPDLQNFALNTYEVEKILSGSSIDLQTPTPTTVRNLLFSKPEPDAYNEDGIATVLNNLNTESSHSNILNGLPNNDSNLAINNYNYKDQYPEPITYSMENVSPMMVKIKEEPQIVPDINVSSPVSPVNMDSQERMKADRKKARNRLAAAKCRKKKLERIALLENRVRELKDENNELGQKQAILKREVSKLKERIVKHYQNGCLIIPHTVSLPYFDNSSLRR